ncbi:MAG: DUF4012 domain-containing protein [Candidatus Roizmanbacteria bacterium]
MRTVTEYTPDDSVVLIIGNPKAALVDGVRTYFETQKQTVIMTTDIPTSVTDRVTLCLCFSDLHHLRSDTLQLHTLSHVIVIISTQDASSHREHLQLMQRHHPHIRFIILQPGHHPVDGFVQRLIQFAFDADAGQVLHLENIADLSVPSHSPPRKKRTWKDWYIDQVSRPARTIALAIVNLALVHLLFLIPFAASLGLLTYSLSAMKPSLSYIQNPPPLYYWSKTAFDASTNMYAWSRPGLSLIGLSSQTDRLIGSMTDVYSLFQISSRLSTRLSVFGSKIINPDVVDQSEIISHLESTEQDINLLSQTLSSIQSQAPQSLFQRLISLDEFHKILANLDRAKSIIKVMPTILGQNSKKTYVLFFANNYELRPGGGFIGSFALIQVQNMHVSEWKVYDVYDADGQLKARIPPPEAISKYLAQPYYFLRDSAFTGDFPSNAFTAQDFLLKELGIESIDGAALLTTSSLENILGAIGPLSIPEYSETVTESNVYLKTQLYSEKKSFSGSIQKKDFIDALFTQLILKLSEPKSALAAGIQIEKSLNEKQSALYSSDTAVQTLLDQWYWSGRQLPYNCLDAAGASGQCILDYTYPIESNLGVNKANAFISRSYQKETKVDADGSVTVTYQTTWFNKSYEGVYPGGLYKNYYQLILPPDIQIQKIVLDTTLVSNFDLARDRFTEIGLMIEIPPRTEKKLLVSYRLPTPLSSEKSQLQTLFQKQLGIPSTDIRMKFDFPDKFTVIDTNISPLARQLPVEYNSTIDSDKFYYFTLSL